ncbi:MAG: histidine kinase [Clostridia bacterium]
MRIHIKLHIKLLLLSLALVIALIALTGVIFYHYNAQSARQSAEAELATLAEKLSLQMEARIQQIDVAFLFMLSDPEFLSALSSYTMPRRDDARNRLLVSDSVTALGRVLRSYAVGKHFRRVVMFDLQGHYFTSDYSARALDPAALSAIVQDIAWRDAALARNGRILLLSPYENPWPPQTNARVYGAARAVTTAAGTSCFIEVQREYAELAELFALPGFEGVEATVLDEAGRVFYATAAKPDADECIFAVGAPNRYGLSVALSQTREAAFAPMGAAKIQIVTICLLALLASFVYIYLSTRRLTRPLRALQETMEQTALDNLCGARPPHSVDELRALSDAFQALCRRLNDAVDAQMRAQNLEMQAHLDTLQAQIDPHFLFNTLNVVSSRAMLIGDQEIQEICDGIATMLRYSTDTQHRCATVCEEVCHVRTYLQLMKRRYKHRLAYALCVEDATLDWTLPKIVLQPLVENALRHGFAHTGGVMRVQVDICARDGGVFLCVSDNGEGFAPDVLRDLNARLCAVRAGARMGARGGEPVAHAIGGMGLVNTYARLYYCFGDACQMRLINAEVGARVEIVAPLRQEECT